MVDFYKKKRNAAQIIFYFKPWKCESRSSSVPKKYVENCFNYML